MIKAWLIIFLLNPNVNSEENFLGKVEVPMASMADCIRAKKKLTQEGDDVSYQFICVTDDHHTGRKYDPGVPLHF